MDTCRWDIPLTILLSIRYDWILIYCLHASEFGVDIRRGLKWQLLLRCLT
jgi:hypothetical protein